MENVESIFLCKIKNVLQLLDEIDDIINNNPKNQQSIDYEISDYLHIIQSNCDNIANDNKLKIIEDICKARNIREQYNNIRIIGQYYNDNRNKLTYHNGREQVSNGLSNLLSTLNQPYKYRVFTQEKVTNLLSKEVKLEKKYKTRKIDIDYETLRSLLDNGEKTKDIAKKYGCSDAYISILKKKYGLTKNRKGDN